MDRKELKGVELRSEELQEVMGKVPPWILRMGITTLFCVVVILFAGSGFFKYPDVIQAQITLTGSTPPVGIIAFSSGAFQIVVFLIFIMHISLNAAFSGSLSLLSTVYSWILPVV